MTDWRQRWLRIMGNTGMYFVSPLAGTTLAQAPSIEASLYSCLVGFIISASREALDAAKEKRGLR